MARAFFPASELWVFALGFHASRQDYLRWPSFEKDGEEASRLVISWYPSAATRSEAALPFVAGKASRHCSRPCTDRLRVAGRSGQQGDGFDETHHVRSVCRANTRTRLHYFVAIFPHSNHWSRQEFRFLDAKLLSL